jgi:hypothetical protein
MKAILYTLLLLAIAVQFSCTKADSGSPSHGAGGSTARYTVVGNYLYLVDHYELKTFDISDPAKLVLKSTEHLGWNIETIYPYKDKLFIGSQSGMFVYSLADPVKPKREGAVNHVRACDPVVANDTVAYVTLRSFGTSCNGTQNVLNVYSVKQAQPTLVKSVTMTLPYGLGIKNNALYVCEGANGLVVFDISKGFDPVKKKTLNDEVYFDVIPYGNLLICQVQGGIRFYDISDPLNPVKEGLVGD